MLIKIEIEVKPDELRRFLGIPDVSGLPEDLAQLARNLLESASGKLEPATLLRANLDVIRRNPTLRRIWLGSQAGDAASEVEMEVDVDVEVEVDATEPPPKKKSRRRTRDAG